MSNINEEKKADKVLKEEQTSEKSLLQNLMEKNLKWSQLIYEQNKKIRSKIMWMEIAGYLRLALIIVPLILAVFFLPPLISQLWSQYSDIFKGL